MADYRKVASRIFGKNFIARNKPADEDVSWQSLSDDLDRLCQTIIFGLRIDANDLQQVLVASLYIKILSNYQAILLLVDRELINESKTLLRGMMEAMFALAAIAKDSSQAQRLVENDHMQRLKLSITYEELPFKLKRALKPKVAKLINSSLNGMARPGSKPQDISPLTVEQLARAAGMSETYYAVYTLLSGCNHLRVYELEQYWNANRAGKSLLTLIYPDKHKSEAVLYTTIKTVLHSLKAVNDTFGISLPREHTLLVKQFRELAATSRNRPRRPAAFIRRKKRIEA